MPIDTSIYGMIQQPKLQSPMEVAGQTMQLKHLMDQSQLAGLQRGELERGIAAKGRLRDLFSSGREVTPAEVMAIDTDQGLAYQQHLLDTKEKQGKIAKTDAETRAALAKYARDSLAQVTDQMSYDAWRADAASKGSQAARNAPAIYDPQWQRKNVMDADKFIAQNTPTLERVTMPDGSIKVVDMNPNTNPQAGQFSAAPAMTPAETARVAELQGHNLEMERIAGAGLNYNTGIQMPQRSPTAIAAAAPRAAPAAAAPVPAAQAAPVPPAPTAPTAPALTPKAQAEAAAKEAERSKEVTRTMNMYIAARDGLIGGLGRSTTGPVMGRIPAVTGKQQIAEGGVSAMAPVLKQLFRVAGEGVFTDKDQELLINMVPTRADRPEARKAKMENIDRIVAAKLGLEVPPYRPKAPASPGKAAPNGSGIKFLGFE